MKSICRGFVVFLLLACNSVFSQEQNSFHRFQIVAGPNWSVRGGDESYQAGIIIPLPYRFHVGFIGGFRPLDPKTLVYQGNVEWDLYYFKNQRIKLNSNFAGFRRYDNNPFDDNFFKHTVGLGYQALFYQHIGIGADYNFVGFFYGSRKDQRSVGNPSVWEAGEIKLGMFLSF